MDKTRRQRADRDQNLAARIESTTQSLREERDRLAKRLADLERELENLANRLESPSSYVTSGDSAPRRS
jgi:predicted  nucleic acid-binding Zn-ribbon protein